MTTKTDMGGPDLNEREKCVVLSLEGCGWLRPMDMGGRDSSHHSATLRSLVRKGVVERKSRGTTWQRGSYIYRLTDEHAAALKAERTKRAHNE